MIDNLISWCIP